MSSLSGHTSSLPVADSRRKQSKRDEAIRKKIESELARKRTISTTHNQGQKGKKSARSTSAKGTVAALKPSPALTVPETITVSDASQLCAAKRTDCVLVVDEDEGLSGIFTAKDLAFRVTAENLDPRHTPVSAIMTRNPMVTRDTTSATEALEVMVQRHFRHLPVCNEEGNVVGLLDITKVFHEALAKVERSSSASQKLYAALEGVQTEFGNGLGTNPQAAAMMAYVDALRDKTALPDLSSVIDARTHPAMVTPKTTVYDAAKLMKENRTTAVCVMEGGNANNQGKIAGIFTSKDIVLRVIAAGLESTRCSVVRVMTPHPDIASPTMTVQDALKKMHAGHYLNLPVVEADGRLIAVVDVLKLTYATLEQMSTLAAKDSDANEGETGPLWGRFFESLAANDDAESAISGSNLRQFSTPPPSRRVYPVQESPHSELFPGDSASAVEEAPPSAAVEFPPLPTVAVSSVANAKELSVVDDGTYVFKFHTPSGRTHRFQALKNDVENLRDIVGGKLEADPFFILKEESEGEESKRNPREFQLAYTDLDNDVVVISSNGDVEDAVKIARKKGLDRVLLQLQGGPGWEESTTVVAETAKANSDPVVDKPEVVPVLRDTSRDDEFYGIPKELLLPASVAGLAVAIVAIFTISRLTRD